MRALRETIPDGTAGLQVKLQRARALVDQARGDPRFRGLALQLVQGVPERDWQGEIGAVSRFVRRTRYTRDPLGVELFTDARPLASAIVQRSPLAAGDCDDFAILGASLLESLGHETRFQVGGFDVGSADPSWAHIWLQVRKPGGGWQTVDDTAKMQPLGWDPAPRFDVTMSARASSRSQQPRLCYGGSSPMQGSLQGFSLKKLGRSLAKPFEQAARKVVPAPVRQVYNKTVGAAWQATGRLYEGAAKTLYKPLVPFMGGAVNTLLPGAGNVAQPIIDRLVGRPQRQPQVPNYPPSYVDQIQPQGSAPDNWGPINPQLFRANPRPSGLTPGAWAAIAGGGALLLVLVMGKRKRGRR